MLEYWMQNGEAALSLIRHDRSKSPKEKDFERLLETLYKGNGKGTKIAVSLFLPIYNKVEKDNRNKKGFAEFFFKQIITKKTNPKLSCTYCGFIGANEMASYVFPYITKRDKYPNIYSQGQIRSLNFCTTCMLTSFAANNRILFKASSPNRTNDYISTIIFFSKNKDDLKRFYHNFIGETLAPTDYTNMNIFGKTKKGTPSYDKVWYAEEFLAVLIDYVSTKVIDFEIDFRTFDKHLGALMFSFTRLSTGTSATNIYDSFDIVNDLNPLIRSFYKLNSKRREAFRILFKNLKTNKFSNDAGDFIGRRRFFRKLLVYHRLDWKTIESLVILTAAEHRSIPYLKSFISILIDVLSLSEKTTFESANNVGYKVGTEVKNNETNPNKSKKLIFEFRRCRRPQDFLSLLNLVQAQLGMIIDNAETFASTKYFEIAKASFLIGLSNAIFKIKKK